MKKIMLPLLATTVLSTMGANAHAAASKEPGIYFYPAKAWVVGHAETATDCAVQSEFNNGFVLQFDGNKQSVQSFTVNFRQNLFSEGQQYGVAIGIPGKLNKTVQATATSGAMLTIPLAGNLDLYKAAKDNAVIDFSIDQNSFRFFLVNFATAAKNFEGCMSGNTPQAEPTAAQVAPVQAAPIEANDKAPALQQPAPQQAQAPANNAPAPAQAAAPAPTGAPEQLIRQNPNAPMENPREASAQPQRQMMQPNAGIAPPPPNAAPEKIATAKDQVNEAIALEQKEVSGANAVPVTEINTEIPEAKITEDKSANMPGNIALQPFHKRMSEQLAEEMSRDPSMIAEDAASNDDFSKPDNYSIEKQQAKIGLKQPPILETASAGSEIILPPPGQPAQIAQQKSPAQPEAMKSITESAISRSQSDEVTLAAAKKIETPDVKPVIEDKNSQPSPERAEELRRQALAQLNQKKQPAPKMEEPAIIATAEIPAETETQPERAAASAAEQIVSASAQLPSAPEGMQPHPSSTPFAQHYDKIETNPDSSPQQQPITAMTPVQPEPIAIAAATPPAKEATPAKPAPDVKNYKTPQPTVRKEVYQANLDLSGQAMDSMEPASAADATRRGADPEMLEKLSDLETKIHKLEKENLALNDELKNSVSASVKESASISSDNWNLERATMRYAEAERQMKRLGEQIQRERAQCEAQKKDVEAQLFDPQITSQQQLAKLADLEQKLAAAQQQLQDQRIRYEERIKILQSQSATQ